MGVKRAVFRGAGRALHPEKPDVASRRGWKCGRWQAFGAHLGAAGALSSLEMRIETSGHKELVRWVLSWVPDVEVLAPRSLRDRVQQKLREALGAANPSSAV